MNTMYKLDPIVCFSDPVPLPKCMYDVANIHSGYAYTCIDSAGADTALRLVKEGPNAIKEDTFSNHSEKPCQLHKMIEERQKKLLQQLESLMTQMLAMKQNLSPNVYITKQTNLQSNPIMKKSDLSKDIVLYADPKSPPYYLLTLQKSHNMKISCHTHSSVASLPAPAVTWAKRVDEGNPSSHIFSVMLIWKLVGVGTKLVTSCTMPVVISGDVNVLRYLVSVVSCNLTYQHQDDSWEIDSILDICHKLQWQKSTTEKQTVLNQLSIKLGKGQWLNDGKIYSIADIAAWNVVKQGRCANDLPANMKTWFSKCEEIF